MVDCDIPPGQNKTLALDVTSNARVLLCPWGTQQGRQEKKRTNLNYSSGQHDTADTIKHLGTLLLFLSQVR